MESPDLPTLVDEIERLAESARLNNNPATWFPLGPPDPQHVASIIADWRAKAAESDELRAKLKQAMNVIEPFAIRADELPDKISNFAADSITVAHLRAARAFLQRQ